MTRPQIQIGARHRPLPAIAFVLLALSGCLPHSCSRPDARSLLPSDSLSREIASGITPGTLELLQDVPLEAWLEHPRTLLHDDVRSRVLVADTRTGRIVSVSSGGTVETISATSGGHPYLIGMREDTLAVFEPDVPRINLYVGSKVVRSIAPALQVDAAALTYAAAFDEGYYLKIVTEGDTSRIVQLSPHGTALARHTLAGPHWRHAGMLRMWGDTLVSLAGYRPVIDLLTPGGGIDSLMLKGFDSPMLARSRRFVRGDVADPPLLTSSADAAGDLLFTLNLRAGWIQIDAYDRSGMLRHVWVQPDPQPGRRFYPVDVAVTSIDGGGGYDLFVLLLQPAARLLHYRAAQPVTSVVDVDDGAGPQGEQAKRGRVPARPLPNEPTNDE